MCCAWGIFSQLNGFKRKNVLWKVFAIRPFSFFYTRFGQTSIRKYAKKKFSVPLLNKFRNDSKVKLSFGSLCSVICLLCQIVMVLLSSCLRTVFDHMRLLVGDTCQGSCKGGGGRGGALVPPVFADQLTLYQTGAQIMFTYVPNAHLDSQILRRACLLWQDLQCMHWRSSPKPLSTIMWQWQNISPIILFIAHFDAFWWEPFIYFIWVEKRRLGYYFKSIF